MKYDDSGTSDEVRSHLTKIGEKFGLLKRITKRHVKYPRDICNMLLAHKLGKKRGLLISYFTRYSTDTKFSTFSDVKASKVSLLNTVTKALKKE